MSNNQRRGATMVEYVLLVALIGIMAISAMKIIGSSAIRPPHPIPNPPPVKVPNIVAGHIGFNCPLTMDIGQTRVLEARVTKNLSLDLKNELHDFGPSETDPIRVANSMILRMTGDNGLEVSPIPNDKDVYDKPKMISDTGSTPWDWQVTAKASGRHWLFLDAYIPRKHTNEEVGIESIRVFSKRIAVQPSAWYSFTHMDWAKIIETLFGSGVIFALGAWAQNRSKAKDTEEANPESKEAKSARARAWARRKTAVSMIAHRAQPIKKTGSQSARTLKSTKTHASTALDEEQTKYEAPSMASRSPEERKRPK